MKVTKQSLIDWMVEQDNKILARITKEKSGVFSVYTRNAFDNKMELFFRYASFKEAKQAAIANA